MPECGGSNDIATAMMFANSGMGGANSPLWIFLLLAYLNRNGGLGCGADGSNSQLSSIQEQLSTNQGQTLLMDAIKENNSSVHELASSINCDFNAVQQAINGIQSAICSVGNQVGMTSAQVINAIQNGNMSLANTLQSCCCDMKQLVTKMGYENQINNLQQSQMIQNGFSQIGYSAAENTCALKQNANDNTNRVIAKLDAIEDSRKDREIASLTAQLTAANSRAERAAELAPIYKALSEIQSKQPSTATVTYPNLVGVPASQLYGYYGASANGGGFL